MKPHAAMKRALATQVAVIRRVTPTVRRGDAEALHAWRVAVRRVRTLLRALPARRLRRVNTAALQSAWRAWSLKLGPARDADVWHETLRDPRLRAALAATPTGRRFLHAQRRGRRDIKQPLDPRLASSGYTRLLARTERAVARDLPVAFATLGARRLERSVRRAFCRLLAKSRRRGRRLSSAERAEEIHALRRSVRRARYLAELCRVLLPKPARRLRAPLLEAQETLGRIHDADVQLGHLRRLPDAARRARNLIVARRQAARRRLHTSWDALLARLRAAGY